ncbi:MAG: hypothetical protein J0G30_06950 [Actinomycetales bacterium]|nr:hypothetical protein [Actinomycetales bacterium]
MDDELEEHRELRDAEPGAHARVRSARRERVLRIAGLVTVGALVVPGILATARLQALTAAEACRRVVASVAGGADAAHAAFEPLGVDGPNWYCYAEDFDGSRTLVRALGLIPGLD